MRSVVKAIVFIICLAAFLNVIGCANKPDALYFDGTEVAEDREFITLRTGQVCEIKDMKITACEYNPRQYAETKQDIENNE